MSGPHECRCSPEAVFELADGALTPERECEVRSHLSGCPKCRELYEEEVNLNSFLRSADLTDLPARSVCRGVAMALPTRPLKARLLWTALALGLLLATLLALSLDGEIPTAFVANALGLFWGVVSGFADLAHAILAAAGPTLLYALAVGALLDLVIAATALLLVTRRRTREV